MLPDDAAARHLTPACSAREKAGRQPAEGGPGTREGGSSPPLSFVLWWNGDYLSRFRWIVRYFSLKRALLADPSRVVIVTR